VVTMNLLKTGQFDIHTHVRVEVVLWRRRLDERDDETTTFTDPSLKY